MAFSFQGSRGLWEPDEGRYTNVALNMLETGDYLLPRMDAEVVALGIPLEVCPRSNMLLGLVPSLAEHPLPRLVDAGLLVTVNTDIPAMTGAGLAEEYRLLRDTFGYGDAAIAEVARAGVRASFAPADVKAQLLSGIDAWLV